MEYKKIWSIYFSPSGTTKSIAENIASDFEGEQKTLDLLRSPITQEKHFTGGDLVVFAFPVFAGRLPKPCTEYIKRLRGENTPAIAAVVYGNRDYDDALLELKNILQEQGFLVTGAAACVAQHSIFTKVGAGRPDKEDLLKIKEFCEKCKDTLEKAKDTVHDIAVKGNFPYKEAGSIPLKPSTDKNCTSCGVCAKICPVHAIDEKNPKETDKSRCISCTACIAACPNHARSFSKIPYTVAAKQFQKKCALRREPEFFIIE